MSPTRSDLITLFMLSQVYFNPELHNHTVELQYVVGVPPATQTLEAYLRSPRDQLRQFDRCAEVMR